MTKKDFEVVAEALAAARPEPDFDSAGIRRAAWCEAVRYVEDALAAHYPRFDRAKFEAACGMGL